MIADEVETEIREAEDKWADRRRKRDREEEEDEGDEEEGEEVDKEEEEEEERTVADKKLLLGFSLKHLRTAP